MTTQTSSIIERKITFQSSSLTLEGTLLLPGADRKYPAVLLLPGSGQVDRDENTSKLAINVMREIANNLASQGIATFRYDKRGVGASQGDYWTTGFHDRVSDAEVALAWLNPRTRSRRIRFSCSGTAKVPGSLSVWPALAQRWLALSCWQAGLDQARICWFGRRSKWCPACAESTAG